jgi:hypothetical protein
MDLSTLYKRGPFKSKNSLRVGFYSLYDEDVGEAGIFNRNFMTEEPVTVMVGDQMSMEAMWSVYQERALKVNEQQMDYDIVKCNCHTLTAALNKEHTDAVKRFAKNGFLRWGTHPEAINVPEDADHIVLSLEEQQERNIWYACQISYRHELRARDYRHSLSADEDTSELRV